MMRRASLSANDLAALERLKRLEQLMDRQFSVAGVQFGIDSIIGLVPVVGDFITGALGFYLISEAKRIGVSRWTLARMYANWGIDVTVGALPVVGDLFDLAFKSNTKNVRMLVAELEKRTGAPSGASTRGAPLDIIEHEPLDKTPPASRTGDSSRGATFR